MTKAEPEGASVSPVDLRLLPAYFAAASCLLLLWKCIRDRCLYPAGKTTRVEGRGSTAAALHLAQLVCVLALLGLTAFDVAARGTVLSLVTLAAYVGSSCEAYCYSTLNPFSTRPIHLFSRQVQ